MRLRDFLDEVKFGNPSSLCVAIIDEEGDCASKFLKGQYWHLYEGNYMDGCDCASEPAIPKSILDAYVEEVNNYPNYWNLRKLKGGNLNGESLDAVVILVECPDDFDEEEYWTPDTLNNAFEDIWPYNIRKDTYEEFKKKFKKTNYDLLRNALITIVFQGFVNYKNLTEEEIEASGSNAELFRLAHKITQIVDKPDDVLALLDIEGEVSEFSR